MPRKPGEQYATKRRKDKERRYNASRPARHEFYATPEWRRLRDWYRARHPLCEECQRHGRVTAAEFERDMDAIESISWHYAGDQPKDYNEFIAQARRKRRSKKGG